MKKALNKSDFSAVILAAGNSSRMGVPKFSLKFNEKHTFLEHIAHEYCDIGCAEIIVVLNESGASFLKQNIFDFPKNLNIVVNEHPEWDRFYSVKSGLKNLTKTQAVFIINVDNPLVNAQVNKALLKTIEETDYAYPIFKNKGGHPVILSNIIVEDIVNEELNQMHFREFLNKYSKKTVQVDDENILVNINTPEEYRHYFNK